jgi:hypothetical protein
VPSANCAATARSVSTFRPDNPGLSEHRGVHRQQLGRFRQPAAEARAQALEDAAGGGDGQLLAGDLEHQRAEDVHRWQVGQPCPRVEIGVGRDDAGKDGIGPAEVRQSRHRAGHGDRTPGGAAQ